MQPTENIMQAPEIEYRYVPPDGALSDYVESFWMLHNHSPEYKNVVILPDGRIDLFLTQSASEPFQVTLMGLGTQADHTTSPPGTRMFAISFKPLGVDYILKRSVASLLDHAENMPDIFWGFSRQDLFDFEQFITKAGKAIKERVPAAIDERKRALFELAYQSEGAITIKALSEKVFWSSRQINRYMTQQYGLSLKAYCNILRFRASFKQLRAGKLFPQQEFADQSHFIREVKRLSGVSPKALHQNTNDRFIQLATLKDT